MTTAAAEFLDTNVIVYSFSQGDKADMAEALLGRGCSTSLLALNEFANVARRKLDMDWREIRDGLAAVRLLCGTILPIDLAIHETALDLAERYRLNVFDALMLASALSGGCTTFWTEDLHDGLLIEGSLLVKNPFRGQT
ncbi:PIN domain-containing protein [Aquibium sp. ELW1220]|uniref:PIN domain-containing protein n=1 Tax=Aquibium sp. ELW1220 TaxID=2976766 RepID=UPI0025B1233F|nr:PIN domain-containing protein [Aquibium sp. ELW1220]MDN2580044.1 PIN domain-containing protein [Aquibium sp. ELW1220]